MKITTAPISRRSILGGAGALTLAGLITACSDNSSKEASSTSSGAARNIEIVTCNFDPYINNFTAITGAAFTERTGITVTPINTGGAGFDSVDQRVQSDLAAGHTPALALIGLNSLDNYINAGRAIALDSLMGQAKFDTSQLYPTILGLGMRNNQLYGMPNAVSTLLMFYNADAFRKAGLDPNKPPTTFSELRTVAEALVSSKAVRDGATFRNDSSGNWAFQNFIASNGGAMGKADGKTPTFNEDAGVEVLEFWASLFSDGLGKTMGGKEMNAAFSRGDLGIMLNSSSQIKSIQSQSTFEVRAAPMPIPDGGQRKCVAGGGALVIISNDEAQQKASFDAIAELVGPAGATNLVEATGYTPVNSIAANDPNYLKTFLSSNPLFAADAGQIEYLVPWFGWLGQHAGEIEKTIDQAVVQAMRGAATPKDALDAAAAKAKDLLSS